MAIDTQIVQENANLMKSSKSEGMYGFMNSESCAAPLRMLPSGKKGLSYTWANFIHDRHGKILGFTNYKQTWQLRSHFVVARDVKNEKSYRVLSARVESPSQEVQDNLDASYELFNKDYAFEMSPEDIESARKQADPVYRKQARQ